jgi:hypothetical protein
MCLVDTKQFRCSEKKIPIWKVVWKDSEGFHSPFRKTKLHRINQVIEITSDTSYQECNCLCYPYYFFENGFFHACATKESAINIKNTIINEFIYPSYSEKHLEIVEGYIPEDTRYAIDVYKESICARKMILNI